LGRESNWCLYVTLQIILTHLVAHRISTQLDYAYPYLLGATPRQIEVKRLYDDNNGFVQNIGFKELKAVAVANSMFSLHYFFLNLYLTTTHSEQPYSEQVKRVCDVVYIANKTQIYRLDMIPLSVQVDRLVSNGAYDDARLLVELVCDEDLPDKVNNYIISAHADQF